MCTNNSSAEVYKYKAEVYQRGEIKKSARVHTSPRRRRTHEYKAGVHKFKAEVYKGRKSKTYFRVHTQVQGSGVHTSPKPR